MVNALETLLQQVVDITILLFEFMGVLVIIAAGLRGIYDYVKRNPSIRLNLAWHWGWNLSWEARFSVP